MANELKHKAVGTVLTQAEFEATDSHAFADQATGDILYASSTTQLRRLGIGSANEVLRTNAGATAPEWASTLSGLTLTNIATAVVGHTTQVAGGNITGEVQVLGTTAADTNITLGRWSENAFGPTLYFVKSRNGAIGSPTTVNDDDTLGAITAYADDGADFATGVASMIFAVDDASVAGSQIGGEIRLRTATSGGSMETAVTIANDQSVALTGVVFINDTDNAHMNTGPGLTINMGTSQKEILALKSSDVGHSFTGLTEDDTFGVMKKASVSAGGLTLESYIDTGANSFYLRGRAASVNTTKSISAYAPIHLQGSILATDTAGAVSENGNLVTIDNLSTVRFIFDAEGSGHADVEWIAYDSHDDLALMDAFQREATGRLTPMRYGDNPLYYARTYMEDIGIVGKDSWHTEDRPDGRVQERQMVNFTKLAMLHHGAILQIGDAMKALEAENRELKALIGGQ